MTASSSLLSTISALFGWIYTLSWSLSFYPQPLLNFRRRSTSGTTINFPFVNVLGFLAYFVSNAAFLFSPRIRHEYALRHHGLTPTVQFNDLAFAGHAIVITAITLSQFFPRTFGWGWDGKSRSRGSGREMRISRVVLGILVGSFLGVAIVVVIVAARHDEDPRVGWAWIDAVYAVSYVKLLITLIKYMPQVLTNYRNSSTHGWSIAQILLDFAGGILSIAQLGIDSYLQGDWSGITGNPVKVALGNVSIFFDIIFITQHYCLYRGNKGATSADGEEDPLLNSERREERID